MSLSHERLEELVGQDRQIRGLDAGQLVDVDDLVCGNCLVDELADRRVDLDGARTAATRVRVLDLKDGRAHVGEQSDVVADRCRLVPSAA